jgi:hypothetical protein
VILPIGLGSSLLLVHARTPFHGLSLAGRDFGGVGQESEEIVIAENRILLEVRTSGGTSVGRGGEDFR